MESEYDSLIEKIETLRAEMVELIKIKHITDPEVIAASQMLDVVLNEYYLIIMKKTAEKRSEL
ncbi:aspartyl-phosphate phosphatase Spo0E family protein [Paenibacillus sp. S3N08]|uniref:Aspartyl-phosphate phosphatase Spo0E family protein n=2 Tax=Paenibacillus agricola TaxID=2716264 RepID=A0ABX0J9A4_9BACL|nr:aspartyl-phosphate phosphatase Spo0E family protein [Paenibacillus agricola]